MTWNRPAGRAAPRIHNHRIGATIEDVEYADADIDFFDDIVKGVQARLGEIDVMIEGKLAKGWTLNRLDKPMKAILRAGTYELIARHDVPVGAVISEYVDVAHAFYESASRASSTACSTRSPRSRGRNARPPR